MKYPISVFLMTDFIKFSHVLHSVMCRNGMNKVLTKKQMVLIV